jgi:hypothetical protein
MKSRNADPETGAASRVDYLSDPQGRRASPTSLSTGVAGSMEPRAAGPPRRMPNRGCGIICQAELATVDITLANHRGKPQSRFSVFSVLSLNIRDGTVSASGHRQRRTGRWCPTHLHHYKVKGSITPEKLAMETAHAEAHKEMKDARGKSRSLAHHTLVFCLVLTAAYIESKESQPERDQKAASKWRKNNPETCKRSKLRPEAKRKGLHGAEVMEWETARLELSRTQQPLGDLLPKSRSPRSRSPRTKLRAEAKPRAVLQRREHK